MEFKQSYHINDYGIILDGLIEEFGPSFCHTLLQWCGIMNDPALSKGENQFWEVWYIVIDDTAVGICGLYTLPPHNTKELWLGWLGLIPEYRNKGLGKDILEFLDIEAKKVNCEVLRSYVDKEGKALSFYNKNGFKVVGNVQEFLHANNLTHIDGENFEDMEDWVIEKKY